MKHSNVALSAILAATVSLIGCGIGDAPKTMDQNELKDALSKATPQQQIDWYNRSPMPAAEKKKKIEEIEQKYGLKPGGAVGPSGAPGG